MKNKSKISILFVFLLFLSCEDDSQITGEVIEPDLPDYIDTDMNGNGGNQEYLGNLYYNFLSDNSYNDEFYKFNNYHLSGGSHNPSEDLLTLKTYQSIYYIPADAVDGVDDNIVSYDSTSGSFQYSENSNISTLSLESSSSHNIQDSLLLTSTVFSVLDSLTWNSSSNRYSFSTIQADKDTAIFQYSQDYDSVFYTTLVDTVLSAIYGDIILLDTNEVVYRNLTEYDTLSVEQNSEVYTEAVKVKRSKTFEINDIFVRNNAMMFRETTDCNNNYQQDQAEKLLEDFSSDCEGEGICSDTQYNNDQTACEDAGETFTSSGNTWEGDDCNSYCSSNPSATMFQMCWDEYALSDRLTGHCVVNAIQNKTFCDTGNNLYDNSPEVYHDADESGSWNLIGQVLEPWEDRDCNGVADVSLTDVENELTGIPEENCAASFGSWDNSLSICFLDEGNGQWDDKETCYTGDGCDYKDLYKRSDAPDVIMVNYEDNQNPVVLLSAYPDDVFNDCGNDNTCNEDEVGYNYGECNNGFSGSLKDCCKYNLCWDYDTESCDYNLSTCTSYTQESDLWVENLDPSGDDLSGSGSQTEGNGIWDSGEGLLKDFNNDGLFTAGTYLVNKTLSYQNCDNNCGGDTIWIIEDSLRTIPISSFVEKVESEVAVSSFNVIDQLSYNEESGTMLDFLNNYNIMKTEFINTSGNNDYDYMLFVDSDLQDENGMHYIIKLIHPYYFFAPGYWNMGDVFNVSNEDFWSSLNLESDTLMYSLNGFVIDGQMHYSSYMVESDTANYQVHKEYVVSQSEAVTSYTGAIADCFKVTRTVTTTMFGSGLDFKLKTETYLKNGFPIVKEDVFVMWAAPPWIGDTWIPISSIEFKQSRSSELASSNFFSNRIKLDLNSLGTNPEFDFKPFRFSNTIGLQRIEYPIGN